MKVWIIQIGEPLLIRGDERKMRSNLLAEELARRGHEVLLWVSAFDHNTKKWAIQNGRDIISRQNIGVKVLRGTGYKKNVSFKRFADHRVISWKFRHLSKKEEKPDVIIASMPPHDLTYQSVRYAKKNNVPVIVDIRDLWPDIFLDNLSKYGKAMGRLLLLNDFRMVKNTMREADSLVAVSNSFLQWGLSYGNRHKSYADRVFYLGYHRPEPQIDSERVRDELREILERLDNREVVIYIGTFSDSQDPSVITECARRFVNSDIVFVFTGYGDLYENVKAELADLQNVFFVGWLNQYEIDALLLKSSIGVCPYSRDSTIFPNKACMYLSAGLPVISSYKGDLGEMIEAEKIGCNFLPGDAESLANAISFLTGDQDVYEEMSRNAQASFESSFVEENIYMRFANSVEEIAETKGD